MNLSFWMANKRVIALVLAAYLPAGFLAAQEPLSVIDWLNENPPVVGAPRVIPDEPPITDTALQPEISVRPLEALRPPVGIVPPSVTGLPRTLWQGSDGQVLSRLISNVPVSNNPAMQTLLYTLLLSEADPLPSPAADETVMLARIDRLFQLGAIDPAQSLTEQADSTRDAEFFRRAFDTALLIGQEEGPCNALLAAPHLSPELAAQIFCTARAGDLATATVMFDGANALGLLDADMNATLERFLYPEIFEDAAPLATPANSTPLLFRLREAIGEPLSTASLPRAFAAADLRDVAGWKAQLEAAERLARTGALGTNKLLGLYTERLPAASGGVWDRVEALQRFETALGTRSPNAVSGTLPAVWRAMQEARLEVPFASLFAEPLSNVALTDQRMQTLQLRIGLLSAGYETVAQEARATAPAPLFWTHLAQGRPGDVPAPNDTAAAIAAAFVDETSLPDGLDARQLGETTLRLMTLFDRGVRGNLNDLTKALSGFRTLGLEDVARRAALQVLLLERERL